ncbi:MAG: hypothetical protein AB2448_09375 [Moorella sp. (in: firmicutes)]
MDLSLHHESYTDDELKMLLIGVSWTVDDDCRVLFSTDVLQVSGDEMEEAETRIKEIMEENKENEEKQEAGQKIMQILAKYPAYGNFIYANMWRKAQPAYQASQGRQTEADNAFICGGRRCLRLYSQYDGHYTCGGS